MRLHRPPPYTVALLISGVMLLGGLGSLFSGQRVWDDAYMFVRYAANLLETGRISWNPGDPPTYGLTAPLYLLVVAPLRVLIPDNPPMVAVFSSGFSGLAFLALMAGWILEGAHPDRRLRQVALLGAVYGVAVGFRPMAAHGSSGMDTMFSLAWVTAFFWSWESALRRESTRRALLAGALGGGFWWVRPELMAYGVLLPTAAILAAQTSAQRRLRLRAGLLVLTGFLALAGLAAWEFGTPLPLSFYVKSHGFYDGLIRQAHRWTPFSNLAFFLGWHWWFTGCVAVGWLSTSLLREWRRCSSELAMLAATLGIWTYHLFFVVDIMGHQQRFFFPTLPAWIWLGTRGLVRRLEPIPEAFWERAGFRPYRRLAFLGAVLMAGTLLPSWRLAVRSTQEAPVGRFNLLEHYRAQHDTYWFCLDALTRLPQGVRMAATEVGYPGVMLPKNPLIDLAGLNDTALALGGFNAQRLFGPDPPEWIYMPHPQYPRMIREIEEHPYFRGHYDYHPARELGVSFGVAILRESPHFPAMRRIIEDGRQGHCHLPAASTEN